MFSRIIGTSLNPENRKLLIFDLIPKDSQVINLFD